MCSNKLHDAGVSELARLGWEPTTSFEALVREMVESDYTAAKRDSLVKLAGFKAYDHHE